MASSSLSTVAAASTDSIVTIGSYAGLIAIIVDLALVVFVIIRLCSSAPAAGRCFAARGGAVAPSPPPLKTQRKTPRTVGP